MYIDELKNLIKDIEIALRSDDRWVSKEDFLLRQKFKRITAERKMPIESYFEKEDKSPKILNLPDEMFFEMKENNRFVKKSNEINEPVETEPKLTIVPLSKPDSSITSAKPDSSITSAKPDSSITSAKTSTVDIKQTEGEPKEVSKIEPKIVEIKESSLRKGPKIRNNQPEIRNNQREIRNNQPEIRNNQVESESIKLESSAPSTEIIKESISRQQGPLEVSTQPKEFDISDQIEKTKNQNTRLKGLSKVLGNQIGFNPNNMQVDVSSKKFNSNQDSMSQILRRSRDLSEINERTQKALLRLDEILKS